MSATPSVKTLAQVEAEKTTGSPYPRCTLWMRVGARALDLLATWAIFFFAGERFGPVLAILYVLLADGMLEGQSIGKRIFGIRVVHLPTRSPGRKRDSTLRNAPLALPILLWMMPEVGLPAFVASAAVIGLVETLRVLKDPLGLRLGDVWAETQVVDGKVVAGAAAGAVDRSPAGATGRVTGRYSSSGPVARVLPRGRRRPGGRPSPMRRRRCG